jgi:hypothetical protein
MIPADLAYLDLAVQSPIISEPGQCCSLCYRATTRINQSHALSSVTPLDRRHLAWRRKLVKSLLAR